MGHQIHAVAQGRYQPHARQSVEAGEAGLAIGALDIGQRRPVRFGKAPAPNGFGPSLGLVGFAQVGSTDRNTFNLRG